jgi:hypothetical protein
LHSDHPLDQVDFQVGDSLLDPRLLKLQVLFRRELVSVFDLRYFHTAFSNHLFSTFGTLRQKLCKNSGGVIAW